MDTCIGLSMEYDDDTLRNYMVRNFFLRTPNLRM
jgi:hypothetical protein